MIPYPPSDVDARDGRVPRDGRERRRRRRPETRPAAGRPAGRRQDELGRQEEARGRKVSLLFRRMGRPTVSVTKHVYSMGKCLFMPLLIIITHQSSVVEWWVCTPWPLKVEKSISQPTFCGNIGLLIMDSLGDNGQSGMVPIEPD